jgi:hypothetical protein
MSAQLKTVDVGGASRTFRTATLADCRECGPRWLVQGLIEQPSVAVVTSEPGLGKTFLLMDLALHVAAGREWFRRKVDKGVVLYVAAEAAESVKRRAALARRVKFGGAALPVEIVLEPALLGDELHSAADREALEHLIDDVARRHHAPVVLVIIDTVAASMGSGNENLDGMQRLTGAANMLAARMSLAVILNHHPNAAGGALRGHGSLLGTVSHAFRIAAKGDARVLTGFKQRDAEGGALLAYRLQVYDLETPDNFGDRSTSCVIEPAEMPADDGDDEKTQQTRLTLAAREAFGSSIGTPVRFGAILDHCRSACDFLADKSPEATRKAVGRALRALEAAGVIKRCEIPRGTYRLVDGSRQ